MKILAVRHVHYEGLGYFEDVLKSRGGNIQYLDSHREDIGDIDINAHDLTVVLGGPMGVYQAEDFPFLKAEMKYLEKRLDRDLPTLGVCLGSQLIAASLGEKVYRGEQGKEVGWHKLTLTEAGKNSPVRNLGPDKTSMLHWHGDTFDLPKGVELLASTEKYRNQIFRIGKNGLAVQCHAELRAEDLEVWVLSEYDMLEKTGQTVRGFREETREKAPILRRQGSAFLNEWLDEVIPQRKAA